MYEGRLVRLRAVRDADIEASIPWLNDLDTMRLLEGGAPVPRTLESERAWVREQGENLFAIETQGGQFLGTCCVFSVSAQSRNCMAGWFIGDPAMRGKGYGSDMILTFLKYLFEERNMERVALTVNGYNAGAIRLYGRLGFVREGVLRENVYTLGRFHDEYVYAMLRREYDALYGGTD